MTATELLAASVSGEAESAATAYFNVEIEQYPVLPAALELVRWEMALNGFVLEAPEFEPTLVAGASWLQVFGPLSFRVGHGSLLVTGHLRYTVQYPAADCCIAYVTLALGKLEGVGDESFCRRIRLAQATSNQGLQSGVLRPALMPELLMQLTLPGTEGTTGAAAKALRTVVAELADWLSL